MKKINIQNKRVKTLLILSAALLVIIIFYSLATMIYRSGKTKTIVRFAPNTATVTLNDTRIANNSTNWLLPGQYHLKVSYNNHFEVYERDVEITEEDAELYGTLNALDDEGKEYITQHREEFAKVEGLVGDLLNRQGQKIKLDYPILTYLPMNNSLYSISYRYDDENKPIIDVKAEPKYLDVAVAKLKTIKNVDLSSQNIVFHTKNPFTKEYQQNPVTDVKKFVRLAYNLSDNYVIDEVQQVGKYYYTSAYVNDYKNDTTYGHYRIILQKKDDGDWEIVATPQPLFTIYNAPGIKKETLDTINSY